MKQINVIEENRLFTKMLRIHFISIFTISFYCFFSFSIIIVILVLQQTPNIFSRRHIHKPVSHVV